jgi:hypothetical protein
MANNMATFPVNIKAFPRRRGEVQARAVERFQQRRPWRGVGVIRQVHPERVMGRLEGVEVVGCPFHRQRLAAPGIGISSQHAGQFVVAVGAGEVIRREGEQAHFRQVLRGIHLAPDGAAGAKVLRSITSSARRAVDDLVCAAGKLFGLDVA